VLARRVTKRGMKAMADVNAAIKETISGISIAKNFRQEESIFKSFDESNQQSYRRQRAARVCALAGLPHAQRARRHLRRRAGLCGRVQRGAGLGQHRRVVSLHHEPRPVLLPRPESLTSFWAQIQSGLSAAERVFALIDADPNVIQTEKQDVPRLKGEIIRRHAFPLFG
jgi:ATP-binding cassette subfamily B protein